MENKNQLAAFDKAVIRGEATWWQMELPSGNVFFGQEKTNMLGYDEKDFKNYKDFTNIVHPEDRKLTMEAMRDHLSGEKDIYETKYRIKTKDGQYIKFYDCGQIISKQGDKIKLMGFVWKIKDHPKVEEDIKNFRDIILNGEYSVLSLVKKIKS